MKEVTITLDEIAAHGPCSDYDVLVAHLGADFPTDRRFPLAIALDVDGYVNNAIDNVLWCMRRCLPQHSRLWRLFAVWCVRQMQHLMRDQRSIDAIDVAERCANSDAADRGRADTATTYSAITADAHADADAYATARATAYARVVGGSEAQLTKLREILTTGELV